MTYKFHIVYFLIFLLLSCNSEDETSTPEPLNFSDDFTTCNSSLSACINGNGAYCLFGFKWGEDQNFTSVGFDAKGPKSSGGQLTFSFQEENGRVNTHRQVDRPSESFNTILLCAKEEIRKALEAWATIANIEFEELAENSESDLQFYIADIIQSGIGYPNYPDSLCSALSGNVIIQENVGITDCQTFYIFSLHEIGHVLGLGHVNTPNVMNADFSNLNLNGLQAGDSLVIVELYGIK